MSLTNHDIHAPGGFAPFTAVSFANGAGKAVTVEDQTPLPVTLAPAGPVTPLAGTASASTMAGPFVPVLGRPIVVTLAGDWSGTVTLLRSVDGGTTKLPLTIGGLPWAVFSGNANEPVAEEREPGATYYLDFDRVSGTLSYRVSQ